MVSAGPAPSIVFVAAMAASMAGLGYAMRSVPMGTAYAAWTGLGAALTVAWSVLFGGEQAEPLKILFLAGIIACAAGLKFADGRAGGKAGDGG
ncbi:DMT family transporter [Arthrobacter sp. GCM10027362]|uniref:DMT family transporter n=1 Tax=Arthrobacter sp. GCM10027362 TaxID=3273379 RepID=UPI00362928EF